MPITREQPDHVFTTTDGSVFKTAEEAHTHEREERLFALARQYSNAKSNKAGIGFSLTTALSDLAVAVSAIVRETPLAETRPLIFVKKIS